MRSAVSGVIRSIAIALRTASAISRSEPAKVPSTLTQTPSSTRIGWP
jgi:hypothetical protein